jgi:hypothetical protein
VAVCALGPLLVGASMMVVHELTEAHVLLPSSQVPETSLSSVYVAMTQCIQFAMCHSKVVMSFMARPHVLVALGLGSTVPPRLTYPSRTEGSRRVQQPQVVGASSSPFMFEAFKAVFGSSLVVFPAPPARHCLWSCFS